ncbi:hypothetical protein GCM10025865_30770 [Paraoerskovia sediminicola]|uniref:RNA-binding S4 domain-containing protein n=1 Tax=Paraoerskovia sediminicola TaxID=1138587 RepID=A0ABM8G6T0_9CELL|nr:hypothetical protein GCM10025865_30770 [Paraoerskovia sediminicola]
MSGARLDAELVRRGLARSRDAAKASVAAGRVTVEGRVAGKPSQPVRADQHIVVDLDPEDPGYASRAAHKLVGALDALERDGRLDGVDGATCLDLGASTGGFTDVLLRRGPRTSWPSTSGTNSSGRSSGTTCG